jgi:hypothetical protein
MQGNEKVGAWRDNDLCSIKFVARILGAVKRICLTYKLIELGNRRSGYSHGVTLTSIGDQENV